MELDISEINLSKTQLHSEDFVQHEIINSKFCITMISDGNGSIGSNSKTDIYQYNNIYELGSTISITTDFYSKYIFKNLTKYLKYNDLNITDIIDNINNDIDSIYKERENTIRFCMLVTILDMNNNKLHTFNIGDCGFSLIDLDNKQIIRNKLQDIKRLSFNGRGTALVVCPNSIHNNVNQEREYINYDCINVPKRFTFIQYSDGLDYDIAIPLAEIEQKIKRTITFDDYDFDDYTIIKGYTQLLKDKLKKDKHDSKYVKYNITKKEMVNISTSYKNSKDILTHIMKQIFSTDSRIKKQDDIAICVIHYG